MSSFGVNLIPSKNKINFIITQYFVCFSFSRFLQRITQEIKKEDSEKDIVNLLTEAREKVVEKTPTKERPWFNMECMKVRQEKQEENRLYRNVRKEMLEKSKLEY